MIAFDQIDLAENCRVSQTGGAIVYVRQGIIVPDGARVQSSVVSAGSLFTIVFLDHVKVGTPRSVRTSAYLGLAHLIEIMLSYLQFILVEPTWQGLDGRPHCFDVAFYSMFEIGGGL